MDEFLLLAAKAAELWRLIGKPTGVPGELPGELAAELIMLDSLREPGAVSTLSDNLLCPKAAETLR